MLKYPQIIACIHIHIHIAITTYIQDHLIHLIWYEGNNGTIYWYTIDSENCKIQKQNGIFPEKGP